MKTNELAEFLNRILEKDKFKDASNNGLQLANDGTLTKVLCGVDANLKLLNMAKAQGAECIVCHHGISWGDSLKYLTGLNYEIIAFAIKNNIAIYACHLPLDAHPELGNNAQLCKTLGLIAAEPAFDYHGAKIGFTAELPEPRSLTAFHDLIREKIADQAQALRFGSKNIHTVGIVSGGAADMIDQARDLGLDLYLTGEPTLVAYNLAEQLRQNVIFAGHYATEIFGVRALCDLIKGELKIPAECVDFKTPY